MSTANVSDVIAAARFSGYQKRVIAICLALGFADGFNSLSIGYAIPDLAHRYGTPPAALAFVVMAALVGEIVAEFLIAPLADRFGRRRVIQAGIVLYSLSAIPAYLATDVTALAACRVLAGLGIGAAVPNVFALGAEYAPHRAKATTITVLAVGTSGGGVVAGLLAAWLVPAYGGPMLLLVAGLVPVALLVLTWPFLPESIEFLARKGRSREVGRLLERMKVDLARDRDVTYTVTESATGVGVLALFRGGRAARTALIWLMMFFALVNVYFVFSWLATLLTNAGIGQSDALLATSIATFGGMVGALAIGMLMDRTRAGVAAAAVGSALALVAVFLMIWGLHTGAAAGVVIALSALLGFGVIGSSSALTAVAAKAYPTAIRATGVGWASGFSRIGGLLAPALGGALLAGGASTTTILALVCVPITLVAVFVISYRFVARTPLPGTSPAARQPEGAPVP